MTQLIKITETNGKKLVSARELHLFLEIKERFSLWFDRAVEYGFDPLDDYTPYVYLHPQNKQEIQDFAIVLDMAKEISMMSKTEKGKIARKYFIECEKQLQQLPSLSNTEILLQVLQSNIANEKKQLELENRIKAIEAKPEINGVIQHFSILGYCNNIKKQISLTDAAAFGRKCTKLCNELGLTTGMIPDPRYGKVKTYPVDVLNQIIKG